MNSTLAMDTVFDYMSYSNGIFDNALFLLEKISDETFWSALMGERATHLMKRYFGNDVVFLGFIVYLAPIVSSYIHNIWFLFIIWLKERLYVTIEVKQDESTFEAIQNYVSSNSYDSQYLRSMEAKSVDDDELINNTDPNDPLYFNQGPLLFPRIELYPLVNTRQSVIYKGYKIWFTLTKESKDRDGSRPAGLENLLELVGRTPVLHITMRAQKIDLLRQFLQEWVEIHHKKKNGKLLIYKCVPSRYDGNEWRQVGAKELRTFDSVILKQGQKECLLSDIQKFRHRERWYAQRGIPYRRGYLLYGPPGTGKTSLVQSIASKINMNVAIISLSGSLTDDSFNVLISEVPRNSILVMEDIDHCTIADPSNDSGNSSESRSKNSRITMSGLLNALDGVTAQEGSMVFMTCNNLSAIQPALLRPGRIDLKMELGYCDKPQVRDMFWRFMDLGSEIGLDEKDILKRRSMLNDIVEVFCDMIPDEYATPAELQNFFIMNMDGYDEEKNYDYLIRAVPGLIKSIQLDREQALSHKNKGKVEKITEVTSTTADVTTEASFPA
ncbi:P-loop containing nucleoside triphosphate hydrolase protein [Spinellus fusiger]|nr:P-loop containing nucleoside triphosphate hydrolase protein [Spinellus fusiger]